MKSAGQTDSVAYKLQTRDNNRSPFYLSGKSNDTVSTADRIIFDEEVSEHHTGKWGINRNITKEISDHYLVWTEFKLS